MKGRHVLVVAIIWWVLGTGLLLPIELYQVYPARSADDPTAIGYPTLWAWVFGGLLALAVVVAIGRRIGASLARRRMQQAQSLGYAEHLKSL